MFEWDESKANDNKNKHGISFADTFAVFEDPNAVTIDEFRHGEQRYVTHWHGRVRSHIGRCIHMARG